jgi:hypothetical protein
MVNVVNATTNGCLTNSLMNADKLYQNNMNIKERQLEVLNDTIKHYNSNNRSFNDDNQCVYYPTKNSEGCAVGRLVKDKALCKEMGSATIYSVFTRLPMELQDLSLPFLNDLQCLHDRKGNWIETGLSENGLEALKHIKKRIKSVGKLAYIK